MIDPFLHRPLMADARWLALVAGAAALVACTAAEGRRTVRAELLGARLASSPPVNRPCGAWLEHERRRLAALPPPPPICEHRRVAGQRLDRLAGAAPRGPRPSRLVLTFDDGPFLGQTEPILDLLRRHRLRGTFFVVGRMVHQGTYRLVQRMVREGHIVGNHTYDHRTQAYLGHPQLRRLVEIELLLTQALVDVALFAQDDRDFRRLQWQLLRGGRPHGPDALLARWSAIERRWRGIRWRRGRPRGRSPYRMIYARPPGGRPFFGPGTAAQREAFRSAFRQAGVINVLWSQLSADASFSIDPEVRYDPAVIVASLEEAAAAGGILLMHDWTPAAVMARGLTAIAAFPGVEVVALDEATRGRFGCRPHVRPPPRPGPAM